MIRLSPVIKIVYRQSKKKGRQNPIAPKLCVYVCVTGSFKLIIMKGKDVHKLGIFVRMYREPLQNLKKLGKDTACVCNWLF